MDLKNFQIKHEDEDNLHILSSNGKSFIVKKQDLSKHAKEVIAKMTRMSEQNSKNELEAAKFADGGISQPQEVGITPNTQPDLATMQQMALPQQMQSTGTPAQMEDPAFAAIHKSPEELMVMATDYAHNVGPAGTVEDVALKGAQKIAPIIEESLPIVKKTAKNFLDDATVAIKSYLQGYENLHPSQQEKLITQGEEAFNAALEHLSPEKIAELNRLEPAQQIQKLMSLPEIKALKLNAQRYKNFLDSGVLSAAKLKDAALIGKAEGGEVQKFAMGGMGVEDNTPVESVDTNAPSALGDTLMAMKNSGQNISPTMQAPIESSSIPMIPQPYPEQSSVIPTQKFPTVEDALNKSKSAALNMAGAIGKQGEEESRILGDLSSQQKALPTQQDIINKYQKSDDDLFKSYQEAKIEPGRLFQNAGTGNKILAGIGMLLSGIGSSLTGQENLAVKAVNNAIERDIDAQKNDKSNKFNLWKMNRSKLGSDLQANLATRNQMYTDVKYQLMKASSQFKGPKALASAQAGIAAVDQELAKNRQMQALLSETQESTGGKGNTEEGFLNHANALGMIKPDLAKQKMRNYLPGIGTTRIAPTDKDRDSLATSKATLNGLSELQALATKGPTIPGSTADAVNKTKIAALQLEMKNAFQLGVLSASDLEMLNKLVADPGSFRTEKAIAELEATKKSIQNKINGIYQKLGVQPFEKHTQPNNEALQWIQNNPNDPRVPAIKQKLGL